MIRKYIAVFVFAVFAAFTFTAGAATAAPATKSAQGKSISFAGGKLTVKNNKGTVKYIVNKNTDCGYSTGQMGDAMSCRNLRKNKYLGKKVIIQWHANKGRRVADLVSVQL